MSDKKRLDRCPICGGRLLADYRKFVAYPMAEGKPQEEHVRIADDPDEFTLDGFPPFPERVYCEDEQDCGWEAGNLSMTKEGVISAEVREEDVREHGEEAEASS